MDIAALKAELMADPLGLDYAALSDGYAAEALNAIRRDITIPKGVIPGCELLAALDPAEVAGLTAIQLQRLTLITSASGGVNTGAPNIRALLGAVFAEDGKGITEEVAVKSRTDLAALLTRPSSRAEQLFGACVAVDATHVAEARRG